MRARTGVVVLGLGLVLAGCSGGGGDPVDAGSVDSVDPDAATVDATIPDARPTDAADVDAFVDGGFDPLACGTGTAVLPLPASGVATGVAAAETPGNVSSTTCNGRGAETAYVFTVDHPVTLDASTVDASTTLDTVLYVRTACQDPATELACDDDVATGDVRSHLTVDLMPGTYFLVVDGRNVGSAGAYTLTTHLYEAPGAPCTTSAQCAPGLTCRAIPPSTQTTCQPPACADGRDDDGDGRTDYPADPGCQSPTDDDEADDCPSGPGCPACADGIDNDGDGLTDYPADLGCAAASSGTEESCGGETEPLLPLTGASATGTTVGAGNQLVPTCATGSTAPERVHVFSLPLPLATLVVDTEGSSFDTVLSLFDDGCATTLACDDDSGTGNRSRITRANVAAGSYAVAIDGFGTAAGAYQINLSGTYAAGAACDPAAPNFTCPTGTACAGAPGAAVCAPVACNDGVDNDGDGLADYPADPGCQSPTDADEADACPSGPGCPVCANGVDDDGDGLIDFPADPGCAAASDDDEASPSCAAESDPLLTVDAPHATGTTVGATNDFAPTCTNGGSPTAPDRVFRLDLAVPVATLTIDTVGSAYDTVLSFADATCAPVLACNDDTAGLGTRSRLIRTAVAAGAYAIILDGYGASAGAYTLNTTGVLPAGGSCADPLVAAGVLACPAGQTCQAGLCAP
ncbi:MAG: hypothetical protein R3B06_03525 [Kofleriaceae bacterium]